MLVMLAVLGLICYFAYDISSVKKPQKRIGRCMFLIGTAFWCLCQIMTFVRGFKSFGFPRARQLFLLPALAFMFLTFYSIFLAIPFDGVKLDGDPVVYKQGVYALCRHPGVLMLVLSEFFIVLALPAAEVITGCSALAVCDIGYAVLQDIWSFPKTLKGYDSYRKETPFLIPMPGSIRAFSKSIKDGKL